MVHLQSAIGEKILICRKAIDLAIEARDNDSKSSVGDKYETNRAMMQIELEKNNRQLAQYLKQKKELSDIDINKTFDKVEFGSLVLTNQGNYLSL